jgi:peptidoglycan hydrolase CwlO-like protein
MQRFLPIVVAMLGLCLVGCKSESEAAAANIAGKQQEMVKILKGVTDKDSAVAAKGKLEALGKEMGELAAKLDKKKANDAEMQKAMDKYKPEMEQANKDIRAEMERIAKIPGAMEPLMQGLMGMGAGLGGPGGGMGMRP